MTEPMATNSQVRCRLRAARPGVGSAFFPACAADSGQVSGLIRGGVAAHPTDFRKIMPKQGDGRGPGNEKPGGPSVFLAKRSAARYQVRAFSSEPVCLRENTPKA